jgi:peptidoglycan/xylan/chitin deacetylase (PgdA/CDA1 family)
MIHQSPDSLMSGLPAEFARLRERAGEATALATIAGKFTRLLARRVRTRSLALRNRHPLVTFTFDDAPASACSTGARIIEQHDARATFYISGGGCGTMSPCGLLASADQVGELWARGHEIGCHTFSHAAAPDIGARELESEIARNHAFLQAIDGAIAARNFAYPYGALAYSAKRALERRFDSCRSVIRGVNAGTADLGAMRAWPLDNATLDRNRIARLIAETVRTNGWLIFASHDVSEQPSQFGVTPDILTFAIDAAQAAGCHVVTTAEGLKRARIAEAVPHRCSH